MKTVKRRLQIISALFVMIAATGTFGFMALEKLSFVEALYFNIVTMATVGYGDIHPTSQASRLFAILLIFMGGATFLGVIANGTEMMLLRRESESRRHKLNMVLGVFFSEVGFKVLHLFLTFTRDVESIQEHFLIRESWSPGQFLAAQKMARARSLRVEMSRVDLDALRALLSSKRGFFINLLENPVLVEQEGFGESLLAMFHLADELESREDMSKLPESDRKHLGGDINRAYQALVEQWLIYLRHLKDQYPYLFSLAVRKNPFDPDASPIVR
jgi:voltage-gated potassium channel